MRTSTILALKHDRKTEVLLCGKLVPISEQLEIFRKFKALKAHADYCEVQQQPSDGPAQIVRLVTPEQNKAFEERKEKENAAAKATELTKFQPKRVANTDRIKVQFKNVNDEIKRLREAGEKEKADAYEAANKTILEQGKKLSETKAVNPQPAKVAKTETKK